MRFGFIGLGHLGAISRAVCCARVSADRRDLIMSVPSRCWRAAPLGEHAEGLAAHAMPSSPACRRPAVSAKQCSTGPDGILAGFASGGTWIEMSTLGRDDILRLAALAAAKGVRTLERR